MEAHSLLAILVVYAACERGCAGAGAGVIAPKLHMNDGNKMPAAAFGTWLGLDSAGNMVHPQGTEMETAVKWALEAGYRHIDTAARYGTEQQVGRAITAKLADGLRRDQLFVTTKLWNDCHEREQVVPALRASLQRLKLQYVDLYLIHWPIGQHANGTLSMTDYVETWRGMMEAKRLGLTRSIGLSNFNQQQIERLLDHGLEVPAALQVELNVNLQQPGLREYCSRRGVVLMAHSALGALFPERAPQGAPPPRVDEPRLQAAARAAARAVPQLVLRYLHELGVVVISKSLKKARIEKNLDIFSFELDDDIRQYLKYYDRNYRTLPMRKWMLHPYYPFEWSLS